MKYLIFACDSNKFRTRTSWVSNANDLFEGEKMLFFETRKEAEILISKGFRNCASYAIGKTHPLFKYCKV